MASGAVAAPVVQTVVLRVSIHCHGCKKKVRKVLRSIEGVQSVTVDADQHKVTVTGTVDANTLVQRLHKSGKKGVPWQYCHPPANNTEPAPAPAPAAPPAQPAGDGGKDVAPAAAAAEKKPEEAVKEPQAESSDKKEKPEQEAEKKPEAESKEEKVDAKKEGGDSAAAEPKGKGAEPAKDAAAAATKDEEESKKNDKPKDTGKAEPAAVTERSLPAPPPPAPKYGYEDHYRQPYYPPPQPVLSYHAAQPSPSVSYFAPQPQQAYSMQEPQPLPAYSMHQPQPQPMQQWSPSYLYVPYPHAAAEPYHQDYYSPPGMHASPPPMQDSYRIFDDENPNSCSVM